MSNWKEHQTKDDGLSTDERIQLRELCVLIVMNEFLENKGKTVSAQRDLIDAED